MKRALRIIGILLIRASVLFLLFSVFTLFLYFHTYDATPEHYQSLYSGMVVTGIIGLVLAVAAAVCFRVRKRK